MLNGVLNGVDGNLLAGLVSQVFGEFLVVGKFEYSEDVFVVFEGSSKEESDLLDGTGFGIVGNFSVEKVSI